MTDVPFWYPMYAIHDDVINWKPFPRYWPFVRIIHQSPAKSPHKGHWHGALLFSLIHAWINDWVNNREAGDLRRHRPHYDVTVICILNYIYFFVAVGLRSGTWTRKVVIAYVGSWIYQLFDVTALPKFGLLINTEVKYGRIVVALLVCTSATVIYFHIYYCHIVMLLSRTIR